MYPYLKNKRYEINKQANTMQSLFSYILARRNSAEKILLKNPVEEIPLKKFLSTSTGSIWLNFFIWVSTTNLWQICNPIDEIPLKKRSPLKEFCRRKPNEDILSKKSFPRNPVEEISSKIILTGILDILCTKGGSDLVWYSIERDIFKTESNFCRKNKSIQSDLGSVYLDLYSLLIPDIKWSIYYHA